MTERISGNEGVLRLEVVNDSVPNTMGGVICPRKKATVHVANNAQTQLVSGKSRCHVGTVTNDENKVAEWNYDKADKAHGPTSWPDGVRQSPIDFRITGSRVLNAEKDPFLLVNYDKWLSGHFYNNGHSVEFRQDTSANTPVISGGFLQQQYRFVQYHYHWSQCDTQGSEHSISGLYFSAELHLVHQGVDDPTKLAVLAVLLLVRHNDVDATADTGDHDTAALRAVASFETRYATKVRLGDKLPAGAAFLRYDGSLTTPPCTENVAWTVFTDPVIISREQLNALRTIQGRDGLPIECNCRRTQHLNDREIFLVL